MIQKVFLIFSLMIFLNITSLNAVIIYPENKEVLLSDSLPVILFDVDGILVQRTAPRVINILKFAFYLFFIDLTERLALLKQIPTIIDLQPDEKYNPVKMYGAFKRFAANLRTEIEKTDLDPFVDYFVTKHPILLQKTRSNIPISEQVKEFVSRAVPKKKVIKLLRKFYDAGYPIIIATNQGYRTFHRAITAQIVPDPDHYTLIYTCDYNIQNTDSPRFFKKPHKEYYIGLKQALAERNLSNRPFIFIDDKIANLEAAAQEGIIGILYEGHKELRRDLKILGLFKDSVVCTPTMN